MREFKDKDGTAWPLDLTIGSVARVRIASEGRFNLINPAGGIATELIEDEVSFWECLWYVVEPHARERKVSAERFGELMAGECLHDSRILFYAEWVDFFQILHRQDKATVVEVAAACLARTMLALQKVEPARLHQLIDDILQKKLNDGSGSLPDSSESTLAN